MSLHCIAILWALTSLMCLAADIPLPQRLQTTMVAENGQPSYYWQATPVEDTAQLLTLFCRACGTGANADANVPLVSVLRDTLGDANPGNDRITYIWLLSYSRLNVPQRILSAIPFFYWRVGDGSVSVSRHDTAPLLDLSAPQHPVLTEIGRDILQWTMLDPMTTAVRASSRAYRTNTLDQERLHLEEAIGYLQQAPVSDDGNALTPTQRDTVIARLELRTKLLGGLVSERRATRVGETAAFEQERIRSRNWELLRQCAEKTGLLFEQIDLAGTTGQYAILWFPLTESPQPTGISVAPIWKLLNVRNPWTDKRLKQWRATSYQRQGMSVVPLGVYSLNYPKSPLLLVDFRDRLSGRRQEMTQRSINELTSGVIGISHFTNWYYYLGADLYDFVAARHGSALDASSRLDCYSQFRVELALDHSLDPDLRKEMQKRVNSLAVNPLEAAPDREIQAAITRYARLQAEGAPDGTLMTRIDKERRFELATFGESRQAQMFQSALHDASFGLYTHRAKKDPGNLATLDCYRRIQRDLDFLDSAVEPGTPPEVAYDSRRIQASVLDLNSLMPQVRSREVRVHAAATLDRLKSVSRDAELQADCSSALASMKQSDSQARGLVTMPRGMATGVPLTGADHSVK
jgi:hypothetical protein